MQRDAPRKDARAAAQVVLQAGCGPVTIGCFLHSRMAGNIYISESPYFGVSDADGRARIDVPDGAVTVHAWHPQQLLEQTPFQAAQAALRHLPFSRRASRPTSPGTPRPASAHPTPA